MRAHVLPAVLVRSLLPLLGGFGSRPATAQWSPRPLAIMNSYEPVEATASLRQAESGGDRVTGRKGKKGKDPPW
jgi:hypothetical protein